MLIATIILLILSIILNIFQHIFHQRTIDAIIDAATDAAVDKVIHPKIWPCEVIFIRVTFDASDDKQIVDFSQYDEQGIIGFDITKRRSPANLREKEINGEILIIEPGAVYSPTEGVFSWVAQP